VSFFVHQFEQVLILWVKYHIRYKVRVKQPQHKQLYTAQSKNISSISPEGWQRVNGYSLVVVGAGRGGTGPKQQISTNKVYNRHILPTNLQQHLNQTSKHIGNWNIFNKSSL